MKTLYPYIGAVGAAVATTAFAIFGGVHGDVLATLGAVAALLELREQVQRMIPATSLA